MANYAPQPIIMNDSVLTLGADNYEAFASKVQLDPTVPVQTYKGLTPSAVLPVVGTPSWMASIEYPQDANQAFGLSELLRQNIGARRTLAFKPKRGGVAAGGAVTIGTGGAITTATAHGLSVGQFVVLGTVTGSTGITAATGYYVTAVGSATTAVLSATPGGAALTTTAGSSTSIGVAAVGYSIDVLLLPGAIGGAVDTIPTGSVQLPCFGQPVSSVS